jgi:lysophospholipase L1-like esterase
MTAFDTPQPRRPGRGCSLLLSLSVVLFACLLLELGLRIFRPPFESAPAVPAQTYRYDSTLGWSLTPNSDAVSEPPNNPVEYRINADGQREDRDYPLQRLPNVSRIVVLGDSRTFGFRIAATDRFSELLELRLRDAEVVNMGVSAYGIDQELLMLQTKGVPYRPDLVLVYVAHFGDTRHMYAERFGRAKPLFLIDDDGSLTLTNVPVPEPGPRNVDEWLREHSRAYNFFALRISRLLGDREPATELADGQPDTQFSEDEINRVAGAILLEMRRTAEASGARLALVSGVPWLTRFAAENGIAALDVAGLVDDPVYWVAEDDSHPNALGNKLLADAIYTFLSQEELLPAERFTPE